MVTLSAKARRFLEAALADQRTAWLAPEVRSLGPDPWSRPLSPRAAQVALDAFRETEKQIRDRLGDPSVDDDTQHGNRAAVAAPPSRRRNLPAFEQSYHGECGTAHHSPELPMRGCLFGVVMVGLLAYGDE